MARLATIIGGVDFEERPAIILGKTYYLEHSVIDDTILKRLGLQDVSDDEKDIIMNAFYVTPPKSTSTLSLQPYPEIQQIIKPLLIDLIHRQNSDIQIMEESAIEDSSIEIVYEKKGKSIGLSILLPSYLLQDSTFNTSQMIEISDMQKGIKYGNVNVNISNSSPGAVSAVFSNAADRLRKQKNLKRAAIAKNLGELPALSEEEMDTIYVAVAVTSYSILQDNIDFYENTDLPKDERERLKMIITQDGKADENIKIRQKAFLSFFTETINFNGHRQIKTTNTRNMLEFLRTFLYFRTYDDTSKSWVLKRIATRDTKGHFLGLTLDNSGHFVGGNDLLRQFRKDIFRYNHLTLIFKKFKHTKRTYGTKENGVSKYITMDPFNKELSPIISNLPPYLAEIVYSFHQSIFEVFALGIMNDKKEPCAGINDNDYETLLVILPDRIIFHNIRLYQIDPPPRPINPNMDDDNLNEEEIQIKPKFIAETTIEIDPNTLNGFIQYDTYDIELLVTSLITYFVDQFEEKHAENFKIASNNAQIRVLEAMLQLMITRMKNRLAERKIVRKGLSGIENTLSEHLSLHLQSAPESEGATLHDIITMLEPDDEIKRVKIDILQRILQTKSDNDKNVAAEQLRKLIRFAESYFRFSDKNMNNGLYMPYEFTTWNNAWYAQSKIIPDNILKLFNVNPIISKLKDNPDFYNFIYLRFMDELQNTYDSYHADYREKREINNKQNESLSKHLNSNRLHELLEQIKEFRTSASSINFLSRLWRQWRIKSKIGNQTNFNKQLHDEILLVCKTSMECAKAAAYDELFQELINAIGAYLRDNERIPRYTDKKIITRTCDIIYEDPISPEVEEVERVVHNMIDNSSENLSNDEEAHLEEVFNAAAAEANNSLDDEKEEPISGESHSEKVVGLGAAYMKRREEYLRTQKKLIDHYNKIKNSKNTTRINKTLQRIREVDALLVKWNKDYKEYIEKSKKQNPSSAKLGGSQKLEHMHVKRKGPLIRKRNYTLHKMRKFSKQRNQTRR
jgi:hypothetical protein